MYPPPHECVKELPYLDRYWIYSELQWMYMYPPPHMTCILLI